MRLSGIVVATITPMTDDGARLADDERFAAYCRFLLAQGVHGLFVCGTTGEGPLLSVEERQRVAALAVRHAGARVPVVVHAGAATTADSIALARHAASIGAAGIAVVTPWFYPLDPAALFAHFKAVADAVPALPVYLYNIPAFAGNAVTPELVARVRAACPNVVGMKHSDANLVRLQEFQAAGGPEFAVLSGSDAVAAAALALGAAGCVTGNASVLPEVPLALYAAVQRGDLAAARRHQAELHEVRALLGDGLNLAAFKHGLRVRGVPVGGVRAPHRPLTPEEAARVETGLADFGRRGLMGVAVA